MPATGHAQLIARVIDPKVGVALTHPPGFPVALERAAVLPRGDGHDAAPRQAVGQVPRKFFTREERRQLYFFNDDECDLRSAFKLLEIDDMAGAATQSARNLETCQQASVKAKHLARAYYDLGMARLAQSRYDEALDLLMEAYQKDGGSMISETIGQARRAEELAAELAQLDHSADLGLSQMASS